MYCAMPLYPESMLYKHHFFFLSFLISGGDFFSFYKITTFVYQTLEAVLTCFCLFEIIFYCSPVTVIRALGKQLSLHQQVIATATMFFKRFYLRNAFSSVEPRLMAAASILLAAKVEVRLSRWLLHTVSAVMSSMPSWT